MRYETRFSPTKRRWTSSIQLSFQSAKTKQFREEDCPLHDRSSGSLVAIPLLSLRLLPQLTSFYSLYFDLTYVLPLRYIMLDWEIKRLRIVPGKLRQLRAFVPLQLFLSLCAWIRILCVRNISQVHHLSTAITPLTKLGTPVGQKCLSEIT